MEHDVQHSKVAFAQTNGIELAYDTFGDPSDPPMLLIHGLGCQLIDWYDDFCRQLAAHRFWVIRYDNRDIGLSTCFDDAGIPDLETVAQHFWRRLPASVPYTLDDMTDDPAGLLDALGIRAAHVVGSSLGGMIAQTLALRHPERVLTLTSIMSSTTDPDLPPMQEQAQQMLLLPPPEEREAYMEQAVAEGKVMNALCTESDIQMRREKAGEIFDRGLHPAGTARQMAAAYSSGSRREALGSIRVPTLVIHGSADPLLPVEHGIDTARSIPNAKLEIVEGLGHDMPPSLWPQLIGWIVQHAKATDP
jgi:pimeloyl-ACP methyl ester carboxylesterase